MTATVTEPVRGKDRVGHRTRPLNRVELLSLLAVMAHVTEFDRCEGTVSNAQIVAMVPGDVRDIRRALKNLADAGVFIRTPGSTAQASTYSFPVPQGGAEPHTDSGVQDPMGGGVPDHEEGGTGPQVGGSQHPTSEAHEASSEEREPALFQARRLVQRQPFEADDVIRTAEDRYGTQPVATAVTAYLDAGTRFSFASDLRRRIDRDLAGTTPAPAQRRWQPCGSCSNGMIETDAGAIRCPTCNPSAMAATA